MSERIDHLAEAARVLDEVDPVGEATYTNAMAYAQVHATLAVAEQLRIANLLEAGEARVEKLDPWDFGSDLADLKPEVREGLGL